MAIAGAVSSKSLGLCGGCCQQGGEVPLRDPAASVAASAAASPALEAAPAFFAGRARWSKPGTWLMLPDPQRHLAYRRVATVPVRRALSVRSVWPARPTAPPLVRQRLGSRPHPAPMRRVQALCAMQEFLPAYSLQGNAKRQPRSLGAQRPNRIRVTLPERCASLRTARPAP